MKPPDPHEKPVIPPRNVTMVESVEEIRARSAGDRPSKTRSPGLFSQGASPPATVPSSIAQAPTLPAPVEDTARFQPVQRPGIATLVVLDDGEEEGEILRIRRESFIIGRVQGDLVIPHDGNISGKHAEIVRRFEAGQWHWYLRDLQSTNGTFVRVAGGILRDGQEVMIGRSCYRFERAAVDESGETDAEASAAGGHAQVVRRLSCPARCPDEPRTRGLDTRRRRSTIRAREAGALGRPRSGPVFDRAARPARQPPPRPDLPRRERQVDDPEQSFLERPVDADQRSEPGKRRPVPVR